MPLDGGSASKRPLYVKIDNNSHARPHYGITKADQVYEWLVEGLTTRLAVVFQSNDPDVIGSVRSARMTDTAIIPSLGGAFVYSGGGPEELMRIHYDAFVTYRYIDLAPSYGWGYRGSFYTLSEHVAPPLTYAKVVRYLDRELRSLELINPS